MRAKCMWSGLKDPSRDARCRFRSTSFPLTEMPGTFDAAVVLYEEVKREWKAGNLAACTPLLARLKVGKRTRERER